MPPLWCLLPSGPQAGLAGLWNERHAMKQHEAMLSLARGRGGSGAEQAGWGLGPTLPSTTGMPWAPIPSQDLCRLHAKCPSPPQWSPPLRRRLGRRKGRPQEDKGREGWRFWRTLSGGPPGVENSACCEAAEWVRGEGGHRPLPVPSALPFPPRVTAFSRV